MKRFWILVLLICSACNLDAPAATSTITATEETVATTEPVIIDDPIVFFVSSETQMDGARQVGCDSFIVPRNTGINQTSDQASNVRTAVEALLTTPVQEGGQINDFPSQNLVVNTVTVAEEDLVIVDIQGNFMLSGVCSDALLTAQILHTIFESSAVNRARVMVGGRNLREIMNESGLPVDSGSAYTREEVLQP